MQDYTRINWKPNALPFSSVQNIKWVDVMKTAISLIANFVRAVFDHLQYMIKIFCSYCTYLIKFKLLKIPSLHALEKPKNTWSQFQYDYLSVNNARIKFSSPFKGNLVHILQGHFFPLFYKYVILLLGT